MGAGKNFLDEHRRDRRKTLAALQDVASRQVTWLKSKTRLRKALVGHALENVESLLHVKCRKIHEVAAVAAFSRVAEDDDGNIRKVDRTVMNFTAMWSLVELNQGTDVVVKEALRLKEAVRNVVDAVNAWGRRKDKGGKPFIKGTSVPVVDKVAASVELELVREHVTGSARDKRRKSTVLRDNLKNGHVIGDVAGAGVWYWIHVHGVVKVNAGEERGRPSSREDLIKKFRYKWEEEFSKQGVRLSEVKNFSATWQGQTKWLEDNVADWARYAVKGGNERLRFNERFGRSLESVMGEESDDSMLLSYTEIQRLHECYVALMDTNALSDERDGYMLRIG